MSFIPIRHTGVGAFSESTSHTAPPRPPDDGMFFRRYHFSGLLCRFNDEFFIQRLDGMDIDYLCADASAASFSAASRASGTQMPVATMVTSVPSRRRTPFSDFKFIIIIVIDYRYGGTAETKVNGTYIFKGCLNCGSRFHGITGIDHYHSGG